MTKEQRKEIEAIYKELDKVRVLIDLIYLSNTAPENEYFDMINAEENRLLRMIAKLKNLDEPNKN